MPRNIQSNFCKLLQYFSLCCMNSSPFSEAVLLVWYRTVGHSIIQTSLSKLFKEGNNEAGQGPLLWIPHIDYREFTQNLNLELIKVHLNTTLKSDSTRVEIMIFSESCLSSITILSLAENHSQMQGKSDVLETCSAATNIWDLCTLKQKLVICDIQLFFPPNAI